MSIKRIRSVSSAGIFGAYSAAGEDTDFCKHTLVYGFNGSGKTTISRLFSTLGEGRCCDFLPEGTRFEIELEDGTIITEESNLERLKDKIAVFNSDFVEANFQWKEGSAKPVFYIGREQAQQGRELEQLEDLLDAAKIRRTTAAETLSRTTASTARFKRETARNIGEQLALRTYNAARLDTDFDSGEWNDTHMVAEERRDALRAVIFQTEALPEIENLSLELFACDDVAKVVPHARQCLTATVGTLMLEDVSKHQSMLGWLKDGYSYHEDNSLENCLLCGGHLTEQRRAAIAEVIDGKFDQIAEATRELGDHLDRTMERLKAAPDRLPSRNDVSQDQRARFIHAVGTYAEVSNQVCDLLLQIRALLTQKAAAPNTAIDPSGVPTHEELEAVVLATAESVAALNEAISKHNEASQDFGASQASAQRALKGHLLAVCNDSYQEAVQQLTAHTTALEDADAEVMRLTTQVEALKAAMRDHAAAAVAVDSLIKSYLRHNDISIAADDEGFQLQRRDGRVARNLSEGEKTAVTFCYFLSSLEAQGRRLQEMIVVVDDPISSLDTKALNYVFSLIKGHVAKCHQTVILTHNINFLNSCRSWLRPKSRRGEAALLFLDMKADSDGARSTTISQLPALIRDYDSEYHYLFSLVWSFSKSGAAADERLFLMPNAMRKVAEIFLAFKRPGADGLGSKIDAIASGTHDIDPARLRALDRLVQLESHADSLEDLVSFSAMTVEESHECAVALMAVIQTLDPDHFALQSRQCGRST